MASAQIKAQQIKDAMQKRKNVVVTKTPTVTSSKSEHKDEAKAKTSEPKSVTSTTLTTSAVQETASEQV